MVGSSQMGLSYQYDSVVNQFLDAVGSSQMGLSYEEFTSLSDKEKNEVIKKTEESFLALGADFTIKTMKELPQLIERINGLILEGKRPNVK